MQGGKGICQLLFCHAKEELGWMTYILFRNEKGGLWKMSVGGDYFGKVPYRYLKTNTVESGYE